MLSPETSIQDAIDGISHWRRVVRVGTNYSISVRESSVKLKASWPSKPSFGGNPLSPLNPLTNLIRLVDSQFRGDQMTIELVLSEMTSGVQVYAYLEGAIDRGMDDYRSLKTHLLTGKGKRDRNFDRYLTEQTKKPEEPTTENSVEVWQDTDPESEDGIQQDADKNHCPHCNSEISTSGIVRPDGFVVCPKCFKRFMPENL